MVLSCNDEPLGDPTHTVHIDYPAAYVVNGGSNNLAVIRLSDFAFTEVIDLAEAPYPHHIYLSPDKNLLAVAITGTDLSGGHGGHGGSGGTGEGLRIQIINPVNGDIHHEIPLMHLPHNAIFNPAGTELWVPQSDSAVGSVFIFSTNTWSLEHTIQVGSLPSEVTFSFDGSKAYVANTGDGTISIIDPIGKNVINTIVTGEDPVGAWSAANGKMYVDNEDARTITEIDVATDSIISTLHLGFVPGYAAYHASSGELWISDATNGRVAYFSRVNDVWTQQGNISTGDNTHAIAFTQDGTKAFVTNQGANTVSILDVAAHAVIKNILVGESPNGIAIRQ
jgi:YVTN family beta-propeller protein